MAKAKRYLAVPFNDRDRALRMGAKWDPSVKRWYAPDNSKAGEVLKWRRDAMGK